MTPLLASATTGIRNGWTTSPMMRLARRKRRSTVAKPVAAWVIARLFLEYSNMSSRICGMLSLLRSAKRLNASKTSDSLGVLFVFAVKYQRMNQSV